MRKRDWLTRPLPELFVMFNNVEAKIESYKVRYELTDEWITRIKLICQTFIQAYAGIMNARATMKDSNTWLESLLYGMPRGTAATAAPIFQATTIPPDAFIGILDEFREMIGFFKANSAYTLADGENLMVVLPNSEEIDTENAAPVLKISVDADGKVTVKYKRGDFSGLELQWRKAGDADWQFVDKSTEINITFTPAGITPPQNIELRAIYLLKNKRVGQWSPVYTLTLG